MGICKWIKININLSSQYNPFRNEKAHFHSLLSGELCVLQSIIFHQ